MNKLPPLLSSLFTRSRHSAPDATPTASRPAEVSHWNEIERRARLGERLFWLNHPRVWHHYHRKSLIEGLDWIRWANQQWGGPAGTALELGCGNGAALAQFLRGGFIQSGVGLDLDESRFTSGGSDQRLSFLAGDVNRIQLEPERFDLVYALQSFHHFEEIDHIMEQVHGSLASGGYFVLDEFVGPRRFQWTDLQLAVTSQVLGLMPKHLRLYANGVEKITEGRSTPEEVMSVSESEAVRSDEIVPAFYRHFEVVHHQKLGGTIQHLLYSGIVHNFPDNDPDVDHLIDCVDQLETSMIEHSMLPSDFVILVGRKRPA